MLDPFKLFAFERTALPIMEALFLLAAIFYSPPAMSNKKLLKTAGFVIHIAATAIVAGFLVMRFFITGHAPFVVLYETLVYFAFSVSLVFLVLSWRKDSFGYGRGAAIFSWILLLAALIKRLVDQSGTYPRYLSPALTNALFEPHAAVAFPAYALFALAFMAAFTSLTASDKEKREQRQSLAEFYLWPGIILFVISAGLGAMASRTFFGFWWSWEAKQIAAIAIAVIFALALITRSSKGKTARLFPWLVLLGFVVVILTWLATNSGLHKFL